MKRLLLIIFLLFLIPFPASASNNIIYLTSTANRNYQGEFINKTFESSLAADGDLGKLVYQPLVRPRVWVVDAALIEDVKALADQNSATAKNWLDQLIRTSRGDSIYATAYGNPDVTYLKSLAPSELNFYYLVGQQHLEVLLMRNLESEKGSGYSYKRANINNELRTFFNQSRKQFTLISTVVNPREVESDRARIGQLFNPQLSSSARTELLRNFKLGQPEVISKLRIVSGRYRITAANQKMPITVVNDFGAPAKVDLFFKPMNNRVVFPEYRQITLNPKSRIQISVPIKTIAAGDTMVIARFENGKGDTVGETGELDISSTIISPTISRFTTGAGIVLVLAAIAQSVRRVRKSRKA